MIWSRTVITNLAVLYMHFLYNQIEPKKINQNSKITKREQRYVTPECVVFTIAPFTGSFPRRHKSWFLEMIVEKLSKPFIQLNKKPSYKQLVKTGKK